MNTSVEIEGRFQANCNKCGKENECLVFLTEIENQGFFFSLITYLCQTCVSEAFKSFDKDK